MDFQAILVSLKFLFFFSDVLGTVFHKVNDLLFCLLNKLCLLPLIIPPQGDDPPPPILTLGQMHINKLDSLPTHPGKLQCQPLHIKFSVFSFFGVGMIDMFEFCEILTFYELVLGVDVGVVLVVDVEELEVVSLVEEV